MSSLSVTPPRSWSGNGLTITVTGQRLSETMVKVSGELDLVSAPILGACLQNELAGGRRLARLDLADVVFFDSYGLSAVLDAHRAFLAARGTLILTTVSTRVARLVGVLALGDELFISHYPEVSAYSADAQRLLKSAG
jgi:anti-sigma B factor antagonist